VPVFETHFVNSLHISGLKACDLFGMVSFFFPSLTWQGALSFVAMDVIHWEFKCNQILERLKYKDYYGIFL